MDEAGTRISIRVQQEDFSLEEETKRLRHGQSDIGAIVTFSGLVREFDGDARVSSLFLEHYPGMTEKSLREIAETARRRWAVQAVTVIHRIGDLKAGEQIVFVGVSGRHRQAAFQACEFIMDYLKTRAPFWKKTRDERGEHWVETRDSDAAAAGRWENQP